LISAGSVLYIRVQQAKKGTGSVALPVDCEALIGKLVIDTAKLGIKVGSYFAPGLGLATGIATGVLPAIK